MIRSGFWPSEHRETGYAGGKGKPQSHSAPYERPVQVAAELDTRIEACGLDGLMLEFVYSAESEDKQFLEQHIANAMRLDINTIEGRIDTALRYVCGKSPRWVDCPGVGDCSQCQGCPNLRDKEGNIKCKKKPRRARSYSEFKSHKRLV